MLNFICSPIGNLNDISKRSISLLESADVIYAEDTRNTNILLKKFNINNTSLTFHEHNEDKITPKIIKQLKDKSKVAIITDAGSPCISDPGYFLSQECIKNGIEYTVIPGPSSVINALILSGMPPDSFTFKGFFPRKNKSKIEIINFLKTTTDTTIFFESAQRICSTVNILSKNLSSDRKIALCREMTKRFEETIRGSIKELKEKLDNDQITLKGEFVIVVDGTKDKPYDISLDNRTKELYLENLAPKDAAKLIAVLTGGNKRDIYNWLIDK